MSTPDRKRFESVKAGFDQIFKNIHLLPTEEFHYEPEQVDEPVPLRQSKRKTKKCLQYDAATGQYV